MNTIFLCLLICVAPPAKEKEDRSLQFNMSYQISKDAKIYLELPVFEVEPKVQILTKEQFRKHARKILQHYNLYCVTIREGEIISILFSLKEVEPEEAPGRSDIATKP